MEPASVVGTVVSVLELKDRLAGLLNRLLLGLIVLPVGIVVWLSLLQPNSFNPVGIVDAVAGWLTGTLDVRVDAAAWVHPPARWLTQRPHLGRGLVALTLITALACRPSLRLGRSLQPNAIAVAVFWLAACATIICGYGSWLTGLGIALAVVLLGAQLLPSESVRDGAGYMLESFALAAFMSPLLAVAPLVAFWYRITGSVGREQVARLERSLPRPRPESVAPRHVHPAPRKPKPPVPEQPRT